MPRRDSKAQHVTVVSRWLENRCLDKWQYVFIPRANPDLAAYLGQWYVPGEHEDIVDRFIGPDGPADREQIAAQLGKLNVDQLKSLAAVAEAKPAIVQDGRPWQITLDTELVRDVEARRGLGIRGACAHLVENSNSRFKRYRGVTADALRKRYLAAKKFSRP